jgi:hypothetical protein
LWRCVARRWSAPILTSAGPVKKAARSIFDALPPRYWLCYPILAHPRPST